jgi:hypothetical protein
VSNRSTKDGGCGCLGLLAIFAIVVIWGGRGSNSYMDEEEWDNVLISSTDFYVDGSEDEMREYFVDELTENQARVIKILAQQTGENPFVVFEKIRLGELTPTMQKMHLSKFWGVSIHWLNSASNTRHNPSCIHYQNTNDGYMCGEDDGIACGKCGG